MHSIAKGAWTRRVRRFWLDNPRATTVLAVGILLTLSATNYVRETIQTENRDYFERRVAEAQGILTQHLRMNLEVLRGLQALFLQAGERPVSRDEFRRYAGHLNLEGRYPGIRALSFTRYVRSDERAAYEAGIRRDAALQRPHFVVKPVGQRADYFVADFISPGNKGDDTMFGVDLGAEANRRATLEQARDSGQPTASPLITLTMRPGGPPGFFVAAPVYRPGAPLGTVAERQRAFVGCVTAVFGSEALMTQLFGERLLTELDIEIYDVPVGADSARYTAEHLLFDSAVEVTGHRVPLHAPTQASSFSKAERIDVADREWSVVFTALPALSAHRGETGRPTVVLAAGATLSLLLFALLASISDANRRLETEVAERTAALRGTNAELAETVTRLTAANRDLALAQEQLLQSEKLASLGQLAAGIAHEVNNPVSFIQTNRGALKGQADGLLAVLGAYAKADGLIATAPEIRGEIEATKQAVDLEFVRQDLAGLIDESLDGVGRVKQIVGDLKDFSRADRGEWAMANLERGIDSTLHIVWNELKYKAQVVKEYAGLPDIECLGPQLNQVFMNLLVNAAHAIEGHGTITIRTGMDAANVWVEVADTGQGIAPENLARIFDAFFTTKPVGQGTGLGLSLALGIVRRHHGTIDVQSEVGQGTRFRVNLPRQRVVETVAA